MILFVVISASLILGLLVSQWCVHLQLIDVTYVEIQKQKTLSAERMTHHGNILVVALMLLLHAHKQYSYAFITRISGRKLVLPTSFLSYSTTSLYQTSKTTTPESESSLLNDLSTVQSPPFYFNDTQSDDSNAIKNLLTRNIVASTYSFFWNFGRSNIVYDSPWQLFTNSTSQLIAWYQFPHNLPPYRYMDDGYPIDMFCYGLEGTTLPLGNWDPFGLQLVSIKVVRKYRESEIKHGRLAMLSCVGFIVQEAMSSAMSMHPEIGGLAITHLQQLRENTNVMDSSMYKVISALLSIVGRGDVLAMTDKTSDIGISLDYTFVILLLMCFEGTAMIQKYVFFKSSDYTSQYYHNIGIANLKSTYTNGDYGFDPFKLLPADKTERKVMVDKELNNGRLAMIAIVGMIGQEYLTGVPIITSFLQWINYSTSSSAGTATDDIDAVGAVYDALQYIQQQLNNYIK